MTKVNAWLFSFIGFSLSKVSNYFMNSIFTWRWNISWVHSDTSVLKVKVKMKSLSRVRLFATPWTVAYQASLSMGFSRQEYWSGLPFPSPGDLPNPEMNPCLPHCRQMLYHLSHQESTHQGSHFSIKLYLISSMLRIMVLKARGNNRILYKYSFVVFNSAHPRSQSANINVIN